MDLFKAITGKDTALYEQAAKLLVNTPNIDLFRKLVKQDDFLFDFVKNNVAKRIQKACNHDNYKNLFSFFSYYSPSYDTVIAEVLYQYGGIELLPKIKDYYINGNNNEKAYAAKFLSFVPNEHLQDVLTEIREYAKSDYEPLSVNSIEILAKLKDCVSKNEAIQNLNSQDAFIQYDAVRFLVTYGAKDCLQLIIKIMKQSTLSENIASEILCLTTIPELINENFDDGILVLCNIVNAIPEIISPSAALDYNFFELFDELYCNQLNSSSALLLRMAKDKFEALCENEEYLYDCDKNTKEEVFAIKNLLEGVNINKLNNLLYEELYEESDFVFFAVDYADNIEELETLLDSKNQTLVLKVLTRLKEKSALTIEQKKLALNSITNYDIKQIIEVL